MKGCVNCRHQSWSPLIEGLCNRLADDPVSGRSNTLLCIRERYSLDASACGEEARFFEPREVGK